MTRTPEYDQLEVGAALPTLTVDPITRQTLAVYCGASGDHNPIHVDSDFAKASGLDDVIGYHPLQVGGRAGLHAGRDFLGKELQQKIGHGGDPWS